MALIERDESNRPDHPSGASGRGTNGVQPSVQPGVLVLCPYCGCPSDNIRVCSHCGGHFDLLSRQRTQNAMGPWFIRDQVKPFHPGCSYATLRRMALRGRLHPDTIIRGPTTRQFWSFARSTPGVSHLLGLCHACGAPADPNQSRCDACDSSFLVSGDRQHLGLAPQQLLPGDAGADAVAEAAFGRQPAAPAAPSDAVAIGAAPPTTVSPAGPRTANGSDATKADAPPSQHAAGSEPELAHSDAGYPAHQPGTEMPVALPRRAPRRRRSVAPAIIVSAAVLLAAAVIAIVLIVTGRPAAPSANPTQASTDAVVASSPADDQSDGNAAADGAQSVNTPDSSIASADPDEGPGSELAPDADGFSPGPQTPASPAADTSTSGPAQPGNPPITSPASAPDAGIDPNDPAPDAPAGAPDRTPAVPGAGVPARLVRLADRDPAELRAMRAEWIDDPEVPESWLRALDRRVLQLELLGRSSAPAGGASGDTDGTD